MVAACTLATCTFEMFDIVEYGSKVYIRICSIFIGFQCLLSTSLDLKHDQLHFNIVSI